MELLIITKKEELEMILDQEKCFLFPVLKDPKKHYCENSISFLYGFTISRRTEFLVGNGHYDIPEFESNVGQIRTKLEHIVYKKKYLTFHENLIDAEILNWISNGETIKILTNTCIDFFHRKDLDNSIIPIYKWVEAIREIRDRILELHEPPVNVVHSYNTLINQLIKIEKNGLYIDRAAAIPDSESLERRLEYTEYNPCTLTGRPSNKFGGINYAALNKTDGTRRRFISRFEGGFLVEFDFQAFHINLIAKILKYSFPEDPYTYLAKEFFNTSEPSDGQIRSSKELTFQQVYGGVRPEYRQIEFFSRLDLLLKKIEMKNREGSVKSFLFKKPIKSTDNHIKTFNYLLQNLETEINSTVMTELHNYLSDKRSKLVLYTYDSFLFDYSPEDGRQIIRDMKKILDKTGINSRIKVGKDYHTMISKELH